MATPHKCPVCDGTGLVSRPPHIAGDVPSWTDSQAGPYPCRPCFGTGVLWDHAAPSPSPWPSGVRPPWDPGGGSLTQAPLPPGWRIEVYS